jgi:hypothetical protein
MTCRSLLILTEESTMTSPKQDGEVEDGEDNLTFDRREKIYTRDGRPLCVSHTPPRLHESRETLCRLSNSCGEMQILERISVIYVSADLSSDVANN